MGLSFDDVQRLSKHEEQLKNKLYDSALYKKASSRMQEVMRDFPPYFMYKFRRPGPHGGMIGQIRLYHEPKKTWSDKAVHVDIYFMVEDNPGAIQKDRVITQCPLDDLERVVLCSAAQIRRMQRGLSDR
jgi:hypothetical protein